MTKDISNAALDVCLITLATIAATVVVLLSPLEDSVEAVARGSEAPRKPARVLESPGKNVHYPALALAGVSRV
jgi:hypothetical protein